MWAVFHLYDDYELRSRALLSGADRPKVFQRSVLGFVLRKHSQHPPVARNSFDFYIPTHRCNNQREMLEKRRQWENQR